MSNRYTVVKNETIIFFSSLVKFKKRNKEKSRKSHRGFKSGHYHNCYEIVLASYFNDESLEYIIQDKIYKVNQNCIVGSPPNVKHLAENGDKKERLILNFSYDYGKEIFDFLGVDINSFFENPVWYYSDEQIKNMFELGEKIIKESREVKKDRTVDITRNYCLKVLFLNFVSILVNPIETVMPFADGGNDIDNIIQYIRRNYEKIITLDSLASRFGMNKYVMCRKFKNKTGVTIMEFVMRVRLNHARELLEEENLKITEIAHMVGYQTSKYFSSEFKKCIGVSPTKYREDKKIQIGEKCNEDKSVKGI